MKSFQLYRKYWALLGVEPQQPLQKTQLINMFLKRLTIYTLFITWIICSTVFIGYGAKKIDEYADAFYMSTCLTCSFSICSVTIWKMDSLFKFFEDFESLIIQRMENPEMKSTYVKLNENIEKWTGLFYLATVRVTAPSVLLADIVKSFYLYFATDLGGEAFSLPFPVWVPFDWRTPTGYLIICAVQLFACYYMAQAAVCFTGTLVSSCYMVLTFCNEIKNDIYALDESSKVGENPATVAKRLKNIVEFYTTTKQLAFDIDDVHALIIVVVFLWGLATMGSILLVIQMGLIQNANPIELVRPVFLSFYVFALIFMICEFGQLLTNRFEQLNQAVNDCDWISFPKEIQKIMPIIIHNTQQPVVLRIFENASCSRETFKAVTNRGLSYFMVFRQFR